MRRYRSDYPEHPCQVCGAPTTMKSYCHIHYAIAVHPGKMCAERGLHGTDVHNNLTLVSAGRRNETIIPLVVCYP